MLKVWFHDLVQHDDTEIWSRIMPSSWTSTFRSDDHDIQEMLETIITCDEVLKVYNVTAEAAYIARVVYSKIPITCALIFWGGVTFWTWWYDTDAFNDHWWSIYTKMKQSASQAMDFCITCRNQYLIYTQTIAFVLWVFFVAAILYVSVYGYPFTIQENLGIVAKVSTFFSDVMKMFGNILTQFFEFCSSTWSRTIKKQITCPQRTHGRYPPYNPNMPKPSDQHPHKINKKRKGVELPPDQPLEIDSPDKIVKESVHTRKRAKSGAVPNNESRDTTITQEGSMNDIPRRPESLAEDKLRNYVFFKAFDIIGDGGYRRFILKNKNNGEPWAVSMYNDTQHTTRFFRATLQLVGKLA
ncbi:hypothetical protein T484DRAFT_1758570, partial [Baffinella frigidus]